MAADAPCKDDEDVISVEEVEGADSAIVLRLQTVHVF